MTITDVASIIHETNRAYCRVIGDNSQPTWNDAPEWQIQSAINGVLFRINNPGSTPRDSHINWMMLKIKDGWTFGHKKDPQYKIHPCMLPYDELPLSQRIKDFLFLSVIDIFIQANVIEMEDT